VLPPNVIKPEKVVEADIVTDPDPEVVTLFTIVPVVDDNKDPPEIAILPELDIPTLPEIVNELAVIEMVPELEVLAVIVKPPENVAVDDEATDDDPPPSDIKEVKLGVDDIVSTPLPEVVIALEIEPVVAIAIVPVTVIKFVDVVKLPEFSLNVPAIEFVPLRVNDEPPEFVKIPPDETVKPPLNVGLLLLIIVDIPVPPIVIKPLKVGVDDDDIVSIPVPEVVIALETEPAVPPTIIVPVTVIKFEDDVKVPES
jgi:hypothetical protein